MDSEGPLDRSVCQDAGHSQAGRLIRPRGGQTPEVMLMRRCSKVRRDSGGAQEGRPLGVTYSWAQRDQDLRPDEMSRTPDEAPPLLLLLEAGVYEGTL